MAVIISFPNWLFHHFRKEVVVNLNSFWGLGIIRGELLGGNKEVFFTGRRLFKLGALIGFLLNSPFLGILVLSSPNFRNGGF